MITFYHSLLQDIGYNLQVMKDDSVQQVISGHECQQSLLVSFMFLWPDVTEIQNVLKRASGMDE